MHYNPSLLTKSLTHIHLNLTSSQYSHYSNKNTHQHLQDTIEHTHSPIFSKLKPIENNNNPPSIINSRNTTSITIQQYTRNHHQPIHTKPLQTHNHKAHGHNQNPRLNPHHTHYLHNPQSTTKPHGHDMALVQSR